MAPSPYLSVTSNFTSEANVETSLTLTYSPTPTQPTSLTISTTLPEDQISPLFSGTAWAGTRLWFSAVDSLTYLHQSPLLTSLPASPSILELGAGLGIPGMCLAKYLESINSGGTVVITDMPSILDQLETNVSANFTSPASTTCPSVVPADLDWSIPGVNSLLEANSLPHFDLLLSTDCVYAPLYGKSYELLAECIIHLLTLNPAAVSVNVVERRNVDEVEIFEQLLKDGGMTVEVVDRGGGYEENDIDALEGKGSSKGDDEEARGKVEAYVVRNPSNTK